MVRDGVAGQINVRRKNLMKFIFEFADSEISQVQLQTQAETATLVMEFSAATVQRLQASSGDRDKGYVKGLSLHWQLGAASPSEPDQLAACLGRISHARLLQAGAALTQLDAPGQLSGPLQLQLSFANGSELRIEALALECCLPADAQFFEVYAC